MAVEILSVSNDDGTPVDPIQVPIAGPTGPDGWSEPIQLVTANTVQTVLDYSAGKNVKLTLEHDTTLIISNWPASGLLARLTLYVVNTGAFKITWPTGTKWSFTPPTNTQENGAIDFYAFTTLDQGATVLGHIIGQNYG